MGRRIAIQTHTDTWTEGQQIQTHGQKDSNTDTHRHMDRRIAIHTHRHMDRRIAIQTHTDTWSEG